MSERTPPDRSEELSFSRAFFGYDPLEVRAYIAEMKGRPEQQQAAPLELLSEEGAPANDYELAAAIDSAVSNIAEVLEAARAAAQKIRDQAGRDAEDSAAAAVEQARRLVAAAESEAYSLRKDAWETAAALLESADSAYANLHSAAERKALEIINNAERNAHRKLAAARRDSENALQTAAAESNQMVEAARLKGREVIRAAEDLAAAANDRADALEQRRQDLAEEVGRLESRLEAPAAPSIPPPPAAVRVVAPDQAGGPAPEADDPGPGAEAGPAPSQEQSADRMPGAGWADGTCTVRLVQNPPPPPAAEVDALDVADEVARLSELNEAEAPRAAAPETRRRPSRPKPLGVPPAGRRPESVEPAPQTRPAPAPAPRPAPRRERTVIRTRAAASGPVKVRSRSADELGALFQKLRGQDGAAASRRPSNSAPSAAERYDRLVLPVVNRALRAVKRRLTDVQGEQIEAIEADPDGWQPQPSRLASSLTHLISVMEREAAEQGRASASEMTGFGLEAAPGEVPAEGGPPFLSAFFDDLAKGVKSARSAGLSGKDLAAAAARVHRTWRIDEAERRLRFLAGRAYHRGLMGGLAEAGVGKYRIEADGGCGECSALAGGVLAEDQVPAVPVHSECSCLVVPA